MISKTERENMVALLDELVKAMELLDGSCIDTIINKIANLKLSKVGKDLVREFRQHQQLIFKLNLKRQTK